MNINYPCPFCGLPIGENEPTLFTPSENPDFSFYAVLCPNCEYHGPKALTPEQALEKWNTRHKLTDCREDCKKLAEAYHYIELSLAELADSRRKLEASEAELHRVKKYFWTRERPKASKTPEV